MFDNHYRRYMTDGRMEAGKRAPTYAALLAYCKLDTFAMVRFWEELKKMNG